jgi:hypothetical protein
MFLGRWEIDDLLTFAVNTHTPSTGAATDADANPAYRVYEDETGTAILTGTLAKLDDAGTTGFYSEQITLSAANGFEVGKSYTVYVSAVVGGVTGTLSHSFQVEAALATAAAVQLIDDLVDDLEGRLTAGRAANLDNLDTTISSRGSAVALALVQADTDDMQGRLPAVLVGGRIDANVGAISTDATAADNLEAILDGGRAALHLTTLDINNPAGAAIQAISSGGNGAGMSLQGHGTGNGLETTAGASGQGSGILAQGSNAGGGIAAYGGASGPGMDLIGVRGLRARGDADTDSDIYLFSTGGLLHAIWAVLSEELTVDGSIGKALVAFIEAGGGGGGATVEEIVEGILAILVTDADGVGTWAKFIVDKLSLITTSTQINVDSPVNAGMLTITKAVSLDSGLLDVTVPAGWTKCYVTGKKDRDDEDSAALFQLVESNPGAGGDGLIRLNGQEVGANEGTLLVDEDNNQVQFALTDNATAELKKRNTGYWDVKFLVAGGSVRPVAGRLQIVMPSTLTI